MRNGLKIKEHKDISRFESIENIPVPGEVSLSTGQHIGSPSEIIVKKGDMVKKGQLVARASGKCSSNLHASIAGKVKAVSNMPAINGGKTKSIIIKKEGEQETSFMEPLKEINADSIRERVKDAGIIGAGGAGFPAHIKLNPPVKIDIAILNGCECEPFLTSDERTMIENAAEIIEGFKYIIKAVGSEKGIIGIEDDKPEAAAAMSRAAGKDMEVAVLPKIYPQGYEKMLITSLTGREVPSGGLPHDAAVSVHNVKTALAVFKAVDEGRPAIDTVVTISGENIINKANARVPVGTAVSNVLQYYNIQYLRKNLIISGGPMMGNALDFADMPVNKTTSGILALNYRAEEAMRCIRCGKCVDVCPMGLVPQEMNRFFEGGDFEKMEDIGLADCMECGCCAYRCPSKIPLVYNFKTAKAARQ
ncbi:MAG: electron transport complex subunit RsxC [Elusimicrobiota bacterium]|nr:electron transport complex subunit RsxC [Elusimicrobiota bacterium]